MLVGSGWGVLIKLTTLSTNDSTIPLSFFSRVDNFVIKLLEPLKDSTNFGFTTLSFSAGRVWGELFITVCPLFLKNKSSIIF